MQAGAEHADSHRRNCLLNIILFFWKKCLGYYSLRMMCTQMWPERLEDQEFCSLGIFVVSISFLWLLSLFLMDDGVSLFAFLCVLPLFGLWHEHLISVVTFTVWTWRMWLQWRVCVYRSFRHDCKTQFISWMTNHPEIMSICASVMRCCFFCFNLQLLLFSD